MGHRLIGNAVFLTAERILARVKNDFYLHPGLGSPQQRLYDVSVREVKQCHENPVTRSQTLELANQFVLDLFFGNQIYGHTICSKGIWTILIFKDNIMKVSPGEFGNRFFGDTLPDKSRR